MSTEPPSRISFYESCQRDQRPASFLLVGMTGMLVVCAMMESYAQLNDLTLSQDAEIFILFSIIGSVITAAFYHRGINLFGGIGLAILEEKYQQVQSHTDEVDVVIFGSHLNAQILIQRCIMHMCMTVGVISAFVCLFSFAMHVLATVIFVTVMIYPCFIPLARAHHALKRYRHFERGRQSNLQEFQEYYQQLTKHLDGLR